MAPKGESPPAFVAPREPVGLRILKGVETLLTAREQAGPAAVAGIQRQPPAGVRVAYLLSRYPAVSHTFFLHEVLGLRARGVAIETASINPPDRARAALPPAEAAEADSTFYLQGGSKLTALTHLLTTVLRHPMALLRGLAAIARLPGLTLARRLFWLLYLAEALLVGRWMQARNLKHLHVHFGGPVASVGMLVAAAWRLPFSLTIHGPEELLNIDAYHLRQKVAAASFVFCISDFCRSQLCQLVHPDQWAKFQVVRLGVDPVILTPSSRTTPANDEARTLEIVCTGRLVAAKGHTILLQALCLLRDRDIVLKATLIGAGEELQTLRAFVARHGLEHQVCFTGALSHSATLTHVRRADLFALASFAEGIPVALMEAMALGLPCISTTIAGIPELIRSGIDGLLVPPANVSALADALETLATQPTLRRTLGAAARQRVIARYNLPLNQELLAQAFAERLAPTPETSRSEAPR